MFIQSSKFVRFSFSFEKHSPVINVTALARKEVHPAKITLVFVPTAVKVIDVPTVNTFSSTKKLSSQKLSFNPTYYVFSCKVAINFKSFWNLFFLTFFSVSNISSII